MRLRSEGFSLVEIMVSLLSLSALGLGVMYMGQQQSKWLSGLSGSSDLGRSFDLIKNISADPKACEYNFKNKQLGDSLDKLLNSDGEVKFQVGSSFGNNNYILTGIKIGEHNTSASQTRIVLSYKKTGDSTRATSLTKSFNLFSKVSGGKIDECLDPSKLSAEGSMLKSCLDMDPLIKGECEKNFENILAEIKELYCKNHPFLEYDSVTKKCKALDAGKSCGGQYVQGYDVNGGLKCYAGPVSLSPQIPTPITPPEAPKPKDCANYSDWSPSPDLTCQGMSFEQTRTCNENGTTEKRQVQGTKSEGNCCKNWSSWSPGDDTVCSGKDFQQTRVCTDAGFESIKDTRNQTGKSTGASCGCTSYSDWVPSSDLTCEGMSFEQTRSCNDNGSIEKRSFQGTKSDMTCCKNWSSWSPSETTQCLGKDFQQTRTCTDKGFELIKDIQTQTGKSTGDGCCGDWVPSTNETCPGKMVTQTNKCPGQTQTVAGTKSSGCAGKSCIYKRPLLFSVPGLQCAEYFCPAENSSFCIGEMKLDDGEIFWGSVGYCHGGITDGCHGSFKVTCKDGLLIFSDQICIQGYIP